MLQAEHPALPRSDSCEDDGNSDAGDHTNDSVDLDSEQLEIDSIPLSSNEENSDDPGPDDPVDVGEDKIKEFVLRTLISKVNHGWSREETMAQIRNFYEVLTDGRIPHKNWHAVLKLLKTLGYQEPRHYKICCGDDHIRLLDHGTPCPECGEDWLKCINYYVLGVHLEDIFFGLRYHKSTLGSLEGTLLHGLHVSHMGLSTKKSGMERGSQTFHFLGH